MQPIVFKLPDLGEGVVEAEIVAWHVRPGEQVHVDQPLVEVMTDKATVTIPSGIDGRVVQTRGEVGDVVAVGSELVSFDSSPAGGNGQTNGNGHAAAATDSPPTGRQQTVVSQRSPDEPPATVPIIQHIVTPSIAPNRELPPLASPAVRRRAREMQVDLHEIEGTGPNGRITHGDVDVHLRTEFVPTTSRRAPGSHTTEVHLAGLRRRIAEKMVTSSSEIPHFTYIEEVDITELESLREHLNSHRTDGQPKLTYLPFIMLSVARALGRFNQLNAHYDDKREVITRYEAVHLGIATQTEQGLCVPVVRHAEAMDLWQAAREMRRITDAARNRSISRNDLAGSTFTVTSLGSMGGLAATPIINHPEVAILGVNKAIDRPVVHKGQIAVRRMVNLSGSFDHRVVDGADGAIFIQCVKDYLEHPATIFI
jgi:2-oxoisovalerate dehydrogenase E2 component (dihydrolipoyl transacylase)